MFLRLIMLLCLSGSLSVAAAPPELLMYCGITMVRPMTEIARAFEKRESVRIVIAQGGSEDLYHSAKKSGVGDWYLPGEPSYRDRHLAEGLLGDYVTVGQNRMVFVVQKGNPKKVRADLREVLRKDIALVMGNAESGSIGGEARSLLERAGIYAQAVKASAFLVSDSRTLMQAMKRKEADLGLSWRATAFFPDNQPHVDVVELPDSVARPQALLLNQLKSSRHPDIARRFMDYASGPEGRAVFRRYGF